MTGIIYQMNAPARRLLAAVVGIALLAGCVATPTEELFVHPDVDRATALFDQARYADAIIACTDINRRDPLTPGLVELQSRIMQRLAGLRQRGVDIRQAPSDALSMADLDRQGILPDTYRQRRHLVGETKPINTLPTAMQQILERPVSIHLENVMLSEIVAQIGASENVNMVADGALDDKTLTIHIENTPLSEVLEYVGRNLGVTFAVGQNIIWVTPGNSSAGTVPLVTRIYRLRKGLSKEEVEGGPDSLGIIEAVTRFVPTTEGADILFNTKAHAVMVKNSRENMKLIEDIIEVLDVRPPQVLIEARFMSTGVTDLRELGIDWLLKSSYKVSDKDGATRSAVNSGATMGFTDFANQKQGLNFTFEGILTDPAFEAVIHALETTGKSRTLSVPRVTTVNNREASLRVGEDFRFFENFELQTFEEAVGDPPVRITRTQLVPSGTPTLEELGIELVVTPSVGADLATIALNLAPEISAFTRWESFDLGSNGVIRLPVFRRSLVKTEVQVRSGETVVMGGLVTSSRVKGREGIPILSRLPLIGQLFRHDKYDDISQNLLIFVTATLISDAGEELIPLTPSEPVTSGGKVILGENDAAEPAVPPAPDATPAPAGAPPAPTATLPPPTLPDGRPIGPTAFRRAPVDA